MVEVHKMELRQTSEGYTVILLVRLSNGKLRSFSGQGLTPLEANFDALDKAEEHDR